MDIYYNIAKTGEGQYREKMSRFLAFAIHIDSSEEAKSIIKDYQNKFHDARHVCWAYMIGAEMNEFQLNDNGEPSGTAGKPILGQIRSHGVTDVVVIVVRYFGGIKLGTSGLITAYKEAAAAALEDAGKKEVFKMVNVKIDVPYITLDMVMRIIKDNNIEIIHQQFDNLCCIHISVRADDAEEILGKMEKTEGISITRFND